MPDTQSFTHWLNHLAGGESRANVLTNSSENPENVTGITATIASGVWLRDETAADVARLYDTVFGRKPDFAGLGYWLRNIESGA